MFRRILSIVLLVVALPFAFLGCGLYAGGLDCEGPDCVKPETQSSPNSYVCSCSCGPVSRDRKLQVTDGADDAEELLSNGTMVVNSPGIEVPFGVNNAQRLGAIRFTNLDIPAGSHIISANVQFTASEDTDVPVTWGIAGEESDNAAAFGSTAHDITQRQFSSTEVPWSPAAWTIGANGIDQRTPNLSLVMQEIVDRPGWVAGNAMVLRITKTGGAGYRAAWSYEGQPMSAPVLLVTYEEPNQIKIGPQDLNVCMLPGHNVNLPDGKEPTVSDLATDCADRVGAGFTGLAEACSYPSKCDCTLQPNTETYAAVCDGTCVENPLKADCSNFDPVNKVVEATNAPGDDPVCLANCPLAFGMYGRRTACMVEGTAHVDIEGESADPETSGIVQFRGTPCPDGDCAVGMEYRLDIAPVTFSKLFGSATFEDLRGIGESTPGLDARISRTGDGSFEPSAVLLSARGRRGDAQQALETGNVEPINFNVKFGTDSPTCELHGNLIGGVDPEISRCENAGPHKNQPCVNDRQCGMDTACTGGRGLCKCIPVRKSEMALGLDLTGRIVNQPPTANAGPDQRVECPAHAILDASASTDLDGDIALYSWLRGGRTGEEVGFDKKSEIIQGLGTQTYVLRTIDSHGQTDEDSTKVTAVDSTPPVLSCSVRVPVITQFNHSMVNVGLSGGSHDACQGDLPLKVQVFADEDDQASTGDGTFAPDARDISAGNLRLRQERNVTGDGRVYLIRVESTDASDNRGFNCCTVVVPHSANQSEIKSVQRQATAAQNYCLSHQGSAPAGFFTVGDGPVIGRQQ